jgi:hypothetical protein
MLGTNCLCSSPQFVCPWSYLWLCVAGCLLAGYHTLEPSLVWFLSRAFCHVCICAVLVPSFAADKVGALLMMDMAHISGLVAAQEAAQVRGRSGSGCALPCVLLAD